MKTLFSVLVAAFVSVPLFGQAEYPAPPKVVTFFQVGESVFYWPLQTHTCARPEMREVTDEDEGILVTREVAFQGKIQFIFRAGQEHYRFVFATPLAGEWAEEKFEVIHQRPGVHTTDKDRGFTVLCSEWENGQFKAIAIDWEGGKLRINSSVP